MVRCPIGATQLIWCACPATVSRNGSSMTTATTELMPKRHNTVRLRQQTPTKTAYAASSSAMYASSSTEHTRARPKHSHGQRDWRRAAKTSSTLSHTAAIIDRAYGRASMPAQVVRGNTAQKTPEATATVRDENCLPSTTTPAAAAPTASPLGRGTRTRWAGRAGTSRA